MLIKDLKAQIKAKIPKHIRKQYNIRVSNKTLFISTLENASSIPVKQLKIISEDSVTFGFEGIRSCIIIWKEKTIVFNQTFDI